MDIPPQPAAAPGAAPPAAPVPRAERIRTLDVLRGFALLGILLVNIELFRGPLLWDAIAGTMPGPTGADGTLQFLIGWLAAGKFLSSFALLFGVGAAIIAGRAVRSGQSPRHLLARRYGWLAVFGLVHMFLLFSGDILFQYAIAGLLLLPFVFARPRTLLWWAGGILGVYLVFTLGSTALSTLMPQPTDDPFTTGFTTFAETRREAAVEAFTSGGVGAQIAARAWEAAFTQGGQLFALPWILSLFLVGYSVGKRGLGTVLDPGSPVLRRAAIIGLGAGLLLNLPLGSAGVLGSALATPQGLDPLLLVGVAIAQAIGAPLLAIGYLSCLALLCRSDRALVALRPLEAAGRMALTGYILQSVLATGFFAWLGYYDQLSTAQSLLVVVVIWVAVLGVCTVWQRSAERGPLEHLWRRLTYGAPTG